MFGLPLSRLEPIPPSMPPKLRMLLQGMCRPINKLIRQLYALQSPALVTGFFCVCLRRMHDRWPVVLTPEAAREWTSADTSVESALELLSTARPETTFKWRPVTKQMSNVKYQVPNTPGEKTEICYNSTLPMTGVSRILRTLTLAIKNNPQG